MHSLRLNADHSNDKRRTSEIELQLHLARVLLVITFLTVLAIEDIYDLQ